MDGILALCHFCETHGPCVILCTQRSKNEPTQSPHTLTVPWCEACQSINLDQAFVSRNEKATYVTTRTPQQQHLAFLLKQAAVRSLSCEVESSKDAGTLYFGDNERGHVISHTFTLRDSLARGFYRRYNILMLMRDKMHLLNSWPFLVRHMKELANDLRAKADKVNDVEQEHKSQRAVRQSQGAPKNVARSLSQLTGQPAVFGHIHLWFTWMLGYEIAVEKTNLGLPLPQKWSPVALRAMCRDWKEEVFHTACFCVVTGVQIECEEDTSIREILSHILPKPWLPANTTGVCKLLKMNEGWETSWSGTLPAKLPTYLATMEKALRDDHLPDSALEHYLNALALRWLHNAESMVHTEIWNKPFLLALGVHNHDMPMLMFWVLRCREAFDTQSRSMS